MGKKKINEAIAIAEDAQGEWSSVTKTYSPDWTHPYKEIIDLLEEALIEAEEAENAGIIRGREYG